MQWNSTIYFFVTRIYSMIPLLTLFITSFCIALSGALMPGPLLTVTISETTRRGLLVGPLLIVGHSILELVLVVILLLALAASGPFGTSSAAAATEDILWGVAGVNFGSPGDYSEVFTVDVSTGSVTIVGAHTGGSIYSDVAMTPNGNLYAVGFDADSVTSLLVPVAGFGTRGGQSVTLVDRARTDQLAAALASDDVRGYAAQYADDPARR